MNWLHFLLAGIIDFDTRRLTFPLAFVVVSISCVSSTYGQLNEESFLVVNSGEEFFVDGGTTEDVTTLLNGGILSNSAGRSTIQGPALVLNSSLIRTNVFTLTLEGAISGQSQNTLTFSSVPYQSPGTIVLSGDNDYQGPTVINSGSVLATNENSLGTTDSGTSITGFGRLSLLAPSSEAFVVDGGVLGFGHSEAITNDTTLQSGEIAISSELQSRIQLDQQGAAAAILRGNTPVTNVVGGVEGSGNLTLQGNLTFTNAGLDHSGDVNITDNNTDVQFNVANAFSGDTIVTNQGSLEVNNSSALGNSSNAVQVRDGGELILNQNVDRDVDLQTGRLETGDGVAFDGDVFASDFSTVGGTGTFRGNIDFANGGTLSGGNFEGTIGGAEDLRISGGATTTRLNAANTFSGITTISGAAEINDADGLGTNDFGTLINSRQTDLNTVTEETLTVSSSAVLNVNVAQRQLPRALPNTFVGLFSTNPTLSLNSAGEYDEVAEFFNAALVVQEENRISTVVVRDGGSVSVDADSPGRLTTENFILNGGSVEGQIVSPSIQKLGGGSASLSELTNFDGDILVEGGSLSVAPGGFGTTNGITRVASENAVLSIPGPVRLQETRVVQEDIFLDNATGIRSGGGLVINSQSQTSVRLEGRLDLGETGSIISAGRSRFSSTLGGRLELAGQITGGDLELLGGSTTLSGDDFDFTGQTIVRNGFLSIREDSRLENTSGIELRNSRLFISNANTQGVQLSNDLIADSVTVDSFNGQLSILSGTQETLGNFRLSRGVTEFTISEGGNLELNGLERATGTLLEVSEDDSQSLQINNFSHTAGEVIPFLTFRSGFATTNETGHIVPLQLRSVAIDDAVASDNVAVLNNDVLSSNTTVAAIDFDNLDLGGNRLKVESGAVRAGRLTNGELTAGATGDFELIVLGGGSTIEANIVDDGENAVSLTIGGTTTLAGTNTFSGTTTVNGDLRVASEGALPDNGKLDISGSSVTFTANSGTQHSLDRIRITDGGSIEAAPGSTPEIEFNRLELEEGTIERNVVLQGNGEIVKTGSGQSNLQHSLFSDFSGTVIVQDGILDTNPLEQTTFRIEGGELRVDSVAESNSFELAGGDLTVFGSGGSTQGILGSIDVSEDSRILLDNNFFLDNEITGTGDLTFSAANLFQDPGQSFTVRNSNENFSGDVTIGFGTNATFAFTDSLGTGDITVADGSTLSFSSTFEGDFSYGSPLAVVNRAITLDNGSIGGRDNAVLADVTVEGLSSISGGKILGTVRLNEQSRLTLSPTESEPVLIGRLEVNGEAELAFGISSFSSAQDPARQITATVFSGVPNSVLNLQDHQLANTDLSLSYNIASGHSLEVLNNGLNADLLISEQERLSGSGTLRNSIAILNGAVISPADELADTLFIDGSLTLDEGAIYEFSGNLEDLSIPFPTADEFSSDLISITDSLTFSASQAQPFILDISGDESFLSLLNSDQQFSFNIASASEIIGFSETAVQFRGLEAGTQLSLRSDGSNLVLSNFIVAVPEPSGALVIFGLSISLLSRRSRRK